jgi:hypothetical protein
MNNSGYSKLLQVKLYVATAALVSGESAGEARPNIKSMCGSVETGMKRGRKAAA